jgi:phage/plasmid-like protein (TIGR03299 family)
MAHELEFVNGTASFFSVNQTAWHSEGTILTQAPTLDEAMQVAHLDYTVEKRPTQFLCTTPDGDTYVKASESAFVTVRTDSQQELGAVGKDYHVMQNADAFRVLEPLLDTGIASLETGGVIRNGADAWLMVKWDLAKFGPIVQSTFADEVLPFGLLANNHNGRRGILLQDTNIRVVCANTLGFAEGSTERRIVIKHSAQGMDKLIEAAQTLWHGIVERYETLATQYDTLRRTMLTQAQFEAAVLDVIAPDPRKAPTFNPEAKLADLVVDRADRKRKALQDAWLGGIGHTGEPNAWYGYNGAVEVLDHNRDLFPTRGGAWRTASLLDGQLRQMKDRTLSSLLALAGQP